MATKSCYHNVNKTVERDIGHVYGRDIYMSGDSMGFPIEGLTACDHTYIRFYTTLSKLRSVGIQRYHIGERGVDQRNRDSYLLSTLSTHDGPCRHTTDPFDTLCRLDDIIASLRTSRVTRHTIDATISLERKRLLSSVSNHHPRSSFNMDLPQYSSHKWTEEAVT